MSNQAERAGTSRTRCRFGTPEQLLKLSSWTRKSAWPSGRCNRRDALKDDASWWTTAMDQQYPVASTLVACFGGRCWREWKKAASGGVEPEVVELGKRLKVAFGLRDDRTALRKAWSAWSQRVSVASGERSRAINPRLLFRFEGAPEPARPTWAARSTRLHGDTDAMSEATSRTKQP